MNNDPQTHNTANSSPGQTERREQLMKIYDELDDTGKQELLKLAIALAEGHSA